MKELLNKLMMQIIKLIDIKSFITLAFVASYIAFTCKGIEVTEQFTSFMSLIIGFYFGSKNKIIQK